VGGRKVGTGVICGKERKKMIGKSWDVDIQFKKRICDLEHEDVWVAMIVNDEDALYCASHAGVFIVVLETLETGRDGGVFFWLGFFGTMEGGSWNQMGRVMMGDIPKGEVGERVPERVCVSIARLWGIDDSQGDGVRHRRAFGRCCASRATEEVVQ
jgi:hypothetical protein